MNFLIIDVETTGLLDPKRASVIEKARVIEFACILCDENRKKEEFTCLINPGNLPLPPKITKMTGIHNRDLIDKNDFSKIFKSDILKFFQASDVIIAHNVAFDVGIIKNEIERLSLFDYSHYLNGLEFICTIESYRHLFGRRMKLYELYNKIIGEEMKNAHRAYGDVAALYEVLVQDNFFKKIVGVNNGGF